jgi:uncharacterized protein (TIGR02217 family)
MTSFHEVRFPDNIAYGATGGPEFATTVAANVTTGLITFTTAPAVGVQITADFEFDVPARFDTDHMAVTIETYRLHRWQQIPIVELRL